MRLALIELVPFLLPMQGEGEMRSLYVLGQASIASNSNNNDNNNIGILKYSI